MARPNGKIEIEDGIPIPPRHYGVRIGQSKYRLAELKIGQSVFSPGIKRNSVNNTVMKAQQRTGWRFTARPAEKDGVAGVRVWRVE